MNQSQSHPSERKLPASKWCTDSALEENQRSSRNWLFHLVRDASQALHGNVSVVTASAGGPPDDPRGVCFYVTFDCESKKGISYSLMLSYTCWITHLEIWPLSYFQEPTAFLSSLILLIYLFFFLLHPASTANCIFKLPTFCPTNNFLRRSKSWLTVQKSPTTERKCLAWF